ncbi:hypothetical protein NST12_01765 [Bacillus sp. FSL W8-1127]|uniref:hypothetical protein n=1 Tax=Bacillus sp. FSL W8-1127 TaxID=2954710 RepID=UPI0030F65B5E
MNIYEALKQINWKKREYFKYKFPDLRWDKSIPPKTKEDFLRYVGNKTINSFERWEKTQEFKNLVMLYLETKVADDFKEIYSIVVDKSKKGDEKAIKLFLQLQKEVQQNAKMAAKTFEMVEDEQEEQEEEDELILD